MRGLLRIASARAPFRRGGLAWAVKGKAGAIDVDICDLDGERLYRLIREPVLTIWGRQEDGTLISMPAINREFSAETAQMVIDAEAERREVERRTEFQSAQGAESGSGGGAPAPVVPEAKDDGAQASVPSSADPEGTPPDAASGGEESREGTDAGTDVATSPVDGEKQPESSPKAPVAAPDSTEKGRSTGRGSRRRQA